jgi:hypothetical protein
MTIKHLLPPSKPTLDLNFAATRQLDPKITFTRASTGTYVDAEGILQTATADEPRFDHDGGTGESLGLLLEESRTNLVADSVDGATAATGDNTIKVSDFETAAGLSMNKFEVNTGQTTCQANLNLTAAAANQWHTFSLFFKFPSGLDRTFIVTSQSWGFNKTIRFNTSTLNVVYTDLNPGEYTVAKLADGVVRVSLSLQIAADLSGLATARSHGDWSPGEYFLIAGYQFEQGAFPTSYIATSGSTVIRAADIASITGTNFSSWYNQSEGTVVSDARITFNDASVSQFPSVYMTNNFPNRLWSLVVLSTTNAVTIGADAFSNNFGTGVSSPQTFRVAQAISNTTSTYSASKDGGAVITGSVSAVVDQTLMLIGAETGGTKLIKRVAYYPRRLTDTQLEALTA